MRIKPKYTLSFLEVANALPDKKDYWLYDAGGLRLMVRPNGSKIWHFNYRFDGKQKTLSLGIFPDVSLADARLAHVHAREQLHHGIDPSEERKKQKALQRELRELARKPKNIVVPAEPTLAHLESIAMRLRHDYGLLPGYQQEAMRAVAYQMYQEVTGQGFYQIPDNSQE